MRRADLADLTAFVAVANNLSFRAGHRVSALRPLRSVTQSLATPSRARMRGASMPLKRTSSKSRIRPKTTTARR